MSIVGFGVIVASLVAAQSERSLDFWVGDWDVYQGDELVGRDKVEKVLGGSAIMEHWQGTDSPEDVGKSFFYWRADSKTWKQVWVVPKGAYKEKVAHVVPNGLRFVGKVYLPNGKSIADRTTLTKLPDGTVHQVIEQARDGKTWKVGFDAIYRRHKGQ
jgi:hypothetical protein